MKLNRKLILILSLALSLALATGGTLAYLSDTDADVNVMTMGNVYIVQNEQERNAQGELVPFTQDKPLYPAVYEGAGIPWAAPEKWPVPDDANWAVLADNPLVVDKFVTVTNTGNSAAYVRTIVAVESTANPAEDGEYVCVVCNAGVSAGKDVMSDWAWLTDTESLKIGDKYFHISYVTYLQPLQPGETSVPSLKQIYLIKETDNTFVEKLGEKFDVLVLSQAVQASGFDDAEKALDAAFGEVNLENVALWLGGDAIGDIGSPGGSLPGGWEDNNPPEFADVTVTTDAELLAAIQDAGTDVICIDGDLTYDWGGDSYANSKALLLKGKTIQGKDVTDSITFKGYGSANDITDATFKNITIKDATVGDDEGAWEHGYLEFVNLTARNVVFANSIMLKGDSTLTGCTVNNSVPSWYGVWVDGGNATFTGCKFTGTRAIKIHEAYSSEVESVTVTDCTFTLSQKPGVVIGDLNADTTVTITGSTFDTTAGDQGKYIYESDTDVSKFTFSESGNTVK